MTDDLADELGTELGTELVPGDAPTSPTSTTSTTSTTTTTSTTSTTPPPPEPAEPAAPAAPAEPADRAPDSAEAVDPRALQLADVEAAIARIGNPHGEVILASARRAALTNLKRSLVSVIDMAIGQAQTAEAKATAARQTLLLEHEALRRKAAKLRAALRIPEPEPDASADGPMTCVTGELVALQTPGVAEAMGLSLGGLLAFAVSELAKHRNVPLTAAEVLARYAREARELGVVLEATDEAGGGMIAVRVRNR